MSKSALYAGLGQGLMALGQGVGNAMQTMALENLRQQNIEKNWARQDKIRSEDNAIQKSRWDKQDEQQAVRDARAIAMDSAKMNRQDAIRESDIAQKESKEAFNTAYTKGENGLMVETVTNKEGAVVSSREMLPEKSRSPKLEPKVKARIDWLQGQYKAVVENEGIESEKAQAIEEEINSLTGNKKIPGKTAPQSALNALSRDPSKADEFKAYYGYLPPGY